MFGDVFVRLCDDLRHVRCRDERDQCGILNDMNEWRRSRQALSRLRDLTMKDIQQERVMGVAYDDRLETMDDIFTGERLMPDTIPLLRDLLGRPFRRAPEKDRVQLVGQDNVSPAGASIGIR